MTHPPRDDRGRGRRLDVPNRYASDDGSPDEGIRGAQSHRELLRALGNGRVLVAVSAVATDVAADGSDKESDMAVVSMVTADGRRGLLAFSGLDAMQAWDRSARPVPVAGVDAANAAIDDGCEALVIDVAGPRRQLVLELDLWEMTGRDRREHVREIAQQAMDQRFAGRGVEVGFDTRALHVQCPAVIVEDVAAYLREQPRILALVPEGVEVRSIP